MAHKNVHNAKGPLIPPHLQPGETVGVIAPSGPPDTEALNSGLKYLEQKGFRVVVGHSATKRMNYLAGTDEQRSMDLNAMLRAQEVRAIMFARGGYGIMRILESVDMDAVIADPKPLVGMSDLTALQLSLYARCGLVTFCGPMVAGQIAGGLDPLSEEWLLRSLCAPPNGQDLIPKKRSFRILREGQATGPFLGGCLSLVTSLLGTSHCPDFTGAILILEDVNEAPYRIDRMLTHLKLAGVLDRIAGLVLGHFLGPGGSFILSDVERRVMELTREIHIPVVSGFPHGHTLPNLTIPCGIPVELTTSPVSLVVSRHDDAPAGR